MDHSTIEQLGLVDRYFRGDVPADQEAEFEAHFFACEACQHELEAARDLRRGIKQLAAREAAHATILQAGVFAWLARRSRALQLGLLAALVLLAALPSAWLLTRPATGPEIAVRATPNEVVDGSTVFLLTALRGASDTAPLTIDPAKLPGTTFTLALDAPSDPRWSRFDIVVTGADAPVVLRREGLTINALEVVMITLPADYLPPGDYHLELLGHAADGATETLARHRLRVASPAVQ